MGLKTGERVRTSMGRDPSVGQIPSFEMERRTGERFPISMDLRYRLKLERKHIAEGVGKTVDISSAGVLFRPRLIYPSDTTAELIITWPVPSDNALPLKLTVVGSVVRSDHRGTAIRIARYRFNSSQKGPPRDRAVPAPPAGADPATNAPAGD